jgi:hypothetical protein
MVRMKEKTWWRIWFAEVENGENSIAKLNLNLKIESDEEDENDAFWLNQKMLAWRLWR